MCRPENPEAAAMRATCEALNVETRLIMAQMKQRSLRDTGRSHSPVHRSSEAEIDGSECSDNETDIESDSYSDSDNEERRSENHGTTWFTSFVADVLLYTTCLTQLGNALECPAPESKHNTDTNTRAIALESYQISTNTDLTTEGICAEEFSILAKDSERDACSPGEKIPTLESGKNILAADSESEEKHPNMFPATATLDVSERVQSADAQLPPSLLDVSYEETYAALDANGPSTVLDLRDFDNSWSVRSRPSSPNETPDMDIPHDTVSSRQTDISLDDNLLINIDTQYQLPLELGPDPWGIPFDSQSYGDLLNPGGALSSTDDMTLFPMEASAGKQEHSSIGHFESHDDRAFGNQSLHGEPSGSTAAAVEVENTNAMNRSQEDNTAHSPKA